MTILFINPLLPEISFLVLDKEAVYKSSLTKNLDNSSTIPRHILSLIDTYNIDEICCVVGPGAFTLMRIITLTCNTLSLSRHIRLKGIHFFDMIPSHHTAMIEANPREYIIRTPTGDMLVPIESIPPGDYEGIFSVKEFTENKTFVQYTEVINDIRTLFEKTPYSDKLSPIYFKSPHITGGNKNTSHSGESERSS